MNDTAGKLEKLRKQQEQLTARIRKVEAAEKTQKRKSETRRKILLGALLDRWMRDDDKIQQKVSAELQRTLERNVDRKVFGFEPLGDVDGRDSDETMVDA